MIDARGPEFADLLDACRRGVQWALQTDNDVLLFGASGTGGLEAAVANLLSPGERALFCTSGFFGDRWATIAEAYGVEVVRLSAPWGQAVEAAAVERRLAAEPDIAKVFVTHSETSTGVVTDVAAIADVVKARGCLLAVDSVSGAPCHPLPVDALGIDVVVTASQKGWLAPPGVVMVALSAAALAAAEAARSPRWYFSFARTKAVHDRGMMVPTPPVSIMFALREGLAMMREEGRDEIWARHERVARQTRAGLRAIGLEPVAAESRASSSVTAVHSPFATADRLARFMTDLRHAGFVLAGALGEMEGKVFRIGHLGAVRAEDIDALLAALDAALTRHEVAA
jgi:aspartate aminotransferase-like enzyme